MKPLVNSFNKQIVMYFGVFTCKIAEYDQISFNGVKLSKSNNQKQIDRQ